MNFMKKIKFIQLKNKSLFVQFFISNLILVSVALITGLVINSSVGNILFEESRTNYENLLSYSCERFYQSLTNIGGISDKLYMDANVDVFTTRDVMQVNSPYDISKLSTLISSYQAFNPEIGKLFVYSSVSDILMTSGNILRFSEVYGRDVKFGDMSAEEFKSQYLNSYQYHTITSEMPVTFWGETKNYILYLTSTTISSKDNVTGCILIMIESERIHDLFERFTPQNNGFIYLHNTSNELITKKIGRAHV